MNSKKTIYYIAFPVFTFLLCLFSYQLGYKRALTHSKQEQITKVLDELDKSEKETSKLTYYQELHEDKSPIVEQVHADQTKKATPPVVIKPSTTVSNPATPPSTTVTVISPAAEKQEKSDKQMIAVQVGAFTDLGKADELTDRLKNAGFEAYTKPIQSKGNELFRVLVKSSKTEATNVQSKLSDQGYKSTFVVTR